MNPIRSFFRNLHYIVFMARIEWEIYNRIAPHVHCERDYGYPFDSIKTIRNFCRDRTLDALPFVQEIERDIRQLPTGYGEAFRFILYRDLRRRSNMGRTRERMYRMLARQRIDPETCDPRFIARRA